MNRPLTICWISIAYAALLALRAARVLEADESPAVHFEHDALTDRITVGIERERTEDRVERLHGLHRIADVLGRGRFRVLQRLLHDLRARERLRGELIRVFRIADAIRVDEVLVAGRRRAGRPRRADDDAVGRAAGQAVH